MYKILRERQAEEELPDRSEEFLDAGGVREESARSFVPGWEDATLGNMYAATSSAAT